MNLKKSVGTLTRVGTTSAFLHNFAQYQSESLPGTTWPLWPNVGPLHRVQTTMIDAHSKALEKMQVIRENADLTVEAKVRRSTAVFDAFIDAVKPGLPAVRETAGNLAAFAIGKLLPVLTLAPADAVGASLDAECRAYASDLPNNERMKLLMDLSRGRDPRIAAAILRGPARISGFTDDQVTRLAAAGIAVAYPEAVITLGLLAIGVRETLMNARSMALDVITNGVRIDKKAPEVSNWIDPGEGYAQLVTWLEPIPLELPGSGPTDEMLKNNPPADDDEESEDAAA
ncbi:hypothetical protein [Pseudomonas halotolerans]|uniref:hypothetical protein n=1 Tax=Pseudomonas halotolerans TaxID=3143552 RepID=UPI0031E2DEB6